MPHFVYPMLLLGCPLGMGLAMWFMMRSTLQATGSAEPEGLQAEIDRLRAEVRLLLAVQQQLLSFHEEDQMVAVAYSNHFEVKQEDK
ncbi:hypothetical protein [Streptomyces sp. H39-S7]|uniref:hypothetical protein n=1 Tax=Streptomyces sp. H39-S7 TaxID=3004357 RepID=UPI0022AEC7FE|nr:hypothetical protein [Streptomyces sp. H39-S7]MCZ4121747.1 hypothetical protein [Streptomyces sp. H39-S7]